MNLFLPLDLGRSAPVERALCELASGGDREERGAVYTKRIVVDGLLDLCGYVPSRNLANVRLMEPSAGDGEFLTAAVQRLVGSCFGHGIPASRWGDVLKDAIVAFELHQSTSESTRIALHNQLVQAGAASAVAEALVQRWFRQDDFLLASVAGQFDVVVGNPPYVRQERIPEALVAEYRRRYSTMYDRADLYVLFYERALDLLAPGGRLGFICANRWIKNKFGGPLREKVDGDFNLDVYIDLEQADAFQEQVDAYPAITVIRRGPASDTRVLTTGRSGAVQLSTVFASLANEGPGADSHVKVLRRVTNGRDPWLLDAPEILLTVRDIEARFPTIEQAGARVGIGVATGADRVFICKFDELPVEAERRLPLVLARDLKGVEIEWSGQGVVNPWLEDGTLAPFDRFPRFASFMESHADVLRKRHTARAQPAKWYKTIDRIYPQLLECPKLLIPDIKGGASVVLDSGRFYPHHNLYVVTSDTWDIRALQAILRSSVALMFVAAYGIRMAGGFLRFQAQYLRRVRVPAWETLSQDDRELLVKVSSSTCQRAIDEVVSAVYGLPAEASELISGFAESARVKGSRQ